MRAKVKIKKRYDGKYEIAVTLPDDSVEYPQEGFTHDTAKSARKDILAMYGGNSTTWDLRRGGRSGGWTIAL